MTTRATDRLAQGRYRLEDREPIGYGAMGTVHLAWDTVLDRMVAVKILAGHLAGNPTFRDRFLREARLAARLCHPNVVQVFDAGDEGQPFLVMEYVDGETLADRLGGRRPLSADELVGLAAQLSGALAYAHAVGVVHRDVKPHNVLVGRDGVAKLTDFGIARASEDSGLTEAGTVLGTAPYMAPEQAAGQRVGPPADVYALGVLLRQVAGGILPAPLDSLVAACLAPDPSGRPAAGDLHRRLLEVAGTPLGARPAPSPTTPSPRTPSPTAAAVPTESPTEASSPAHAPASTAGAAEFAPASTAGAAEFAAPREIDVPTEVAVPTDVAPATLVEPAGAGHRSPSGLPADPPARPAWTGAAAVLLVVVLALLARSAGPVWGRPAPAPGRSGPPATAPAPSAPAPAATAATGAPPAQPVPTTTPADGARDLANWLRSHAH